MKYESLVASLRLKKKKGHQTRATLILSEDCTNDPLLSTMCKRLISKGKGGLPFLEIQKETNSAKTQGRHPPGEI